jgi:hypothetical protein
LVDGVKYLISICGDIIRSGRGIRMAAPPKSRASYSTAGGLVTGTGTVAGAAGAVGTGSVTEGGGKGAAAGHSKRIRWLICRAAGWGKGR